ncbi:MAG: BrnA antitoxin family protein, partial [Kiloniellales bacterium]
MKKVSSRWLTRNQKAELEALVALPDDQIDLNDIPEVRDWSGAERGLFYRPLKKQLTLRLDADVVAWFKSHARGGRGYQTDINRALREHV